jgi:hypothetical protein
MTPIKLTQDTFARELNSCLTIKEVTANGFICEYIDLALYKRDVLIQIVNA